MSTVFSGAFSARKAVSARLSFICIIRRSLNPRGRTEGGNPAFRIKRVRMPSVSVWCDDVVQRRAKTHAIPMKMYRIVDSLDLLYQMVIVKFLATLLISIVHTHVSVRVTRSHARAAKRIFHIRSQNYGGTYTLDVVVNSSLLIYEIHPAVRSETAKTENQCRRRREVESILGHPETALRVLLALLLQHYTGTTHKGPRPDGTVARLTQMAQIA